MKLEQFKILHKKFSKLPLAKEVWQSDEYKRYIDQLNNNKEFYEWSLIDKFEKYGFNYSKFCCITMAEKILDGIKENGQDEYDNPDVIIRKWENGTYGIPIHDGGSSMVQIVYCPWCGTELKKASR